MFFFFVKKSIIDGANFIHIFKFKIYIFMLSFHYGQRATLMHPVILF